MLQEGVGVRIRVCFGISVWDCIRLGDEGLGFVFGFRVSLRETLELDRTQCI